MIGDHDDFLRYKDDQFVQEEDIYDDAVDNFDEGFPDLSNGFKSTKFNNNGQEIIEETEVTPDYEFFDGVLCRRTIVKVLARDPASLDLSVVSVNTRWVPVKQNFSKEIKGASKK